MNELKLSTRDRKLLQIPPGFEVVSWGEAARAGSGGTGAKFVTEPGVGDVHINADLTDFAIGMSVGGGFTIDSLWPIVPVQKESDLYRIFGREELQKEFDTKRADGDTAKEFRWASTQTTYQCFEYALRKLVTDRTVANADAPIRPRLNATRRMLHNLKMGAEIRFHDLAVAAANYGANTAAGSAHWNIAGTDIEADIDAACDAIELACGMRPNTWMIPRAVYTGMKNNTKIQAYLTNGWGVERVQRGELPSPLFGLNVVIPGALTDSAMPGLAPNISRIWSEDISIIAYVDPNPDIETMTWGVQFRALQQGQQVLVSEYRDDPRKGNWNEVSLVTCEAGVNWGSAFLLTDLL